MPFVISPPEPATPPSTSASVGSGRVVVPKLRVPLQLSGSALAVVEQNSPEEIAACTYAVVATPYASRLEEPDFGVEDADFEQLPHDLDEWIEQIAVWEPRAEVATSEEIEDVLALVTVRAKPR